MIDLHCHLLPGIDDGPSTIEEALEMARIAVANGITAAHVTPHLHVGRWENDQPKDVGLTIGQAFRITPHTIHQMEAKTDCDVLEVSTPHLDDVVRLKDLYGREGTSAP